MISEMLIKFLKMSVSEDSKFLMLLTKRFSNMRDGKNVIPVSMMEHS